MKIFWKKGADGVNFDLKGYNIKNGEPFYDGLYEDRDLVSKQYVDVQNAKQDITIDKQDIAINNKLSKDGTSQMEGALDMNNNKIINVGDATEQDGDAINYRYFNRERGVLTGLINNASVQAVQRDGSVPMTGNLNGQQQNNKLDHRFRRLGFSRQCQTLKQCKLKIASFTFTEFGQKNKWISHNQLDK